MTLTISRVSVMEDVSSLIIHHVKRQSSIHSDEKSNMKKLLKQFLPTLYSMTPAELSDDEDDDDVDKGMLPVVLNIPYCKYICTGEYFVRCSKSNSQ